MYYCSITKLAHNKLSHKLSANGPIDWDGLSDLFDYNSIDYNNKDLIINPPSMTNNNNPRNFFVKSSIPLSANQESASFRTVGPYEDSTITYNGTKMTDVLDTHRNIKIKPGYYGRSRLTR